MTFDTGIIPIRIREDLIVRIAGIPYDLSPSEADRIARVIIAFANAPKGKGDPFTAAWKPDR